MPKPFTGTHFVENGYQGITNGYPDLSETPEWIFGIDPRFQSTDTLFIAGTTQLSPYDMDVVRLAHDASVNLHPIQPGSKATVTFNSKNVAWFEVRIYENKFDGTVVELDSELKHDFVQVNNYTGTLSFTMPSNEVYITVVGGSANLAKIDYSLTITTTPPPGARDDGPVYVELGESITIDVLANDIGSNLKIDDYPFEDETELGVVTRSTMSVKYDAGMQAGEDVFFYRLADGTVGAVTVVVVDPNADTEYESTPDNDDYDAGAGLDSAKFHGNKAQYVVQRSGDSITVTDIAGNGDGTDQLSGVERLEFQDAIVAYDIGGNAGQVYRLYKAAFDRTPDKNGLSSNVSLVDGDLTLTQMSAAFAASQEFKDLYGSTTNAQFVSLLYNNVLDRAPDQGGLNHWTNVLNTGQLTRADVLIGFSESPENHNEVNPTISNGIILDPFFFV
jgi:hypothetical protein